MKDMISVRVTDVKNCINGSDEYYVLADVLYETWNCDAGPVHFTTSKKLVVGALYSILYENSLAHIHTIVKFPYGLFPTEQNNA